MDFAYELPLWWERTYPMLAEGLRSPDFDALLLLRWSVQCLAISLLIFLADYLLGAGLLYTLSRRYELLMPAPLRIALSLGLGNGLGGLLVFGLGAVRRLTPAMATIVLVASAIAGAVLLWRQSGGFRWAVRPFRALRPTGISLALLVLFAPLLALQELDLQMPVLEGDSMLYHMASARWYAEHHALAYHPGIRFNAQPQQTVMLYLRHWLITGEETQLKLVNWEYLAILFCTLLGGVRLLGARRLAPAAILLVLASPVFCWTTKMEMADLGMTTYLTLGVVLLLRALRQPSWIWCGLAGLMLGFAGASKLQGLVTVAGFVLVWLALTGFGGQWKVRELMRPAAWLAAGIALPGVGWWIRSLWFTGSPAYPFLSGSPEAKALFAVSMRYGLGHDALALLTLPWHMFNKKPYIFADPYIFGFPMLILVLVGFAAVWRTRARVSPAVLFLLGGFLAYFSFWFFTGQVMRYLASMLPVMALLLASALVALRLRQVRWWAIAPLALVAILAAATPSRMLLHGVLSPVTDGQQAVVRVTALPHYRAVRALNRLAHPRERVYLWFCEDARFHVRATSYGDWLGDYSYQWLGRGATSTQQMLDRLRGAGFKYIMVDRDRAKQGGVSYRNDFLRSAFVLDEGTSGGAELVIREGRYRVFKID